jgi:hypothetical protein
MVAEAARRQLSDGHPGALGGYKTPRTEIVKDTRLESKVKTTQHVQRKYTASLMIVPRLWKFRALLGQVSR